MRTLVTGAAGFIGSHAVKRLLETGHDVVGVDSLVRGHREAIDRLERWARSNDAASRSDGRLGRLSFHEFDIADDKRLARLLLDERVEAVMHFAAFTSVAESVEHPALYYEANVVSTLRLLAAVDAARRERPGKSVQRFIFSSSAAVYGQPDHDGPIPETTRLTPMSPYGTTKLICERALVDFTHAQQTRNTPFASASLRYFNVAGADPDRVVGEVHEPETHLVPLVIKTALNLREPVTVFGDDYPTPDGSAVRDYVHVCDLVAAHEHVAEAIQPESYESPAFNLGLGEGFSVKQVIEATEIALSTTVPNAIGPRRPGDPASLVADPAAFQKRFGWAAATQTLERQVEDAAAWFRAHPNGFTESTVVEP